MPPLLSIKNLHVSAGEKPILKGLSLEIGKGEIHAIMGPNGSGKSTLANVLMGHPGYTVTEGSVRFRGKNLLTMKPDERSRSGLFLAFQYPREIAGVPLRSFLYAAVSAQREAREEKKISPIQWKKMLTEQMEELKMDPAFAERPVNQGFSGGEKKKAEILQMRLLSPSLALLDETDSGLDIDALRIVAEGIGGMRSSDFSALVVTHYARILHHLKPDRVHVMMHGTIIASGDQKLANVLEKDGYTAYTPKKGIRLHGKE